MVRVQCFIAAFLFSSCLALPTSPEATTAEPEINNVIEDLRIQCSNNDGMACIKFKFLNLLDQALKKDNIQVTENVSVEKNTEVVPSQNVADTEKVSDSEGRGFLDQVDEYFKSHDVVFQLPQVLGGSRIAVSPRNLDNNEIALKLKLQDESSQVEGKGRKNRRLRRLLVPLIIFVLLKAMTLIPLAVGVLGLKAWNALQLSFFSFVVSISLAIFQLCKKIASDSAVPSAAAHAGPWEAYNQYAAARNFLEQAAGVAAVSTNEDPQALVYNSHVPH